MRPLIHEQLTQPGSCFDQPPTGTHRNVAGIKLRGASFLMHQVYDDETTFKLVAAASQVSGLPMEVCLEEFGKHFLVYCQKNGYDQILRVLGSNLYDFLTNLDNLHDHLASIYPGMRAPSFRVTRNLESNGGGVGVSGSGIGSSSASSSEGHSEHQQQQQQHGDDGSHMSLAAGSMYLHYYSERNGLSPIVKGLVLAVAREFFSTDIVVTECKLLKPQLGHAHDHVVLKIDRRSQADIQLDERTSQAVSQAAAAQQAAAAAATQQVRADSPSSTGSPQQMKEPQLSPVARSDEQKQTAREQHHQQLQNQHQQQQQQHKTMLSSAYGDTMSKLASDSLINSEIMMQTFPFHVIFDRYFNLVQVGNALLRVTSLYWQRRQQTASRRRHMKKSGDGDDDHLIKFGDLFSIVRPKIEFTFDAIADHTNQVFVVKTRPLVLNADYYRSIAEESGGGGVLGGGCHPSSGSSTNAYRAAGGSDSHQSRPGQSLCPMSRMAMKRRSCAPRLTSGPPSSPPPETSSGAAEAASADVNSVSPDANGCGAQATATKTAKETTTKRPSAGGIAHHNRQQQHGHHHHGVENDSGNELSSFNLLSLRLKGQMIILSGPMGASASGAPINQDQAETASGSGRRSGSERDSAGETTAATETTTAAQAAPEQQGPFCLYLCSPRVDHLDQLMECGVKMSDLALHDRARELMLMSHTHKEDREAVKKLDQATNDLKKMDTKLRQENKRTNEVLHNIFPAKIATLLSHGTKIESESFDPVTCLYSDIIGFTKMCGSENVRPIDIVRLLNTLYLQFDNLTNIHGVYKVETIGDAYVIVGGLPEPLEDHADRCVRMGLDMVKVIATVRSPADNQPIQMRIGIHSGPVMAGIVGIRVPRYSLFGNTTTLANQLETHGVGGKIHISDVTLKNLIKRDRFVIEDNPNQISGFPFKTYFVTNYLGDQTELLKHEKILEEQLIKDFELMGNEVELVDDSSRVVRQHQQQKQHHHHYQQQQHPAPETTAGELTRSLADKSTAATRGASGEADTSTQRLLTEAGSQRTALDQEQASAGSRTTTTATSQQTTRKQHRHHHNRTTPDTTRDSLVLMDVEDNGQSAQSRELLQQQQQPFKELLELSNKLSDDILAEALVEFEDLQTLERLLALLTTSNRSVCSRIVACLGLDLDGHRPTTVGSQQQQQQAEGSKNHQQRGPIKSATSKASGQSGCPFCLDDERRLLAGETDRNRMKLIAIAASIALRLTGEAQFVPALQLVANGASGSSGSASTSGTSGDQRMPSLGERVLEQSTAGLSGGDQDGIVVGTTGDNNVMMPVRSTRPDVRGELLAGTRRTNQQEDGRDNRTIEPMGTSATMTAVAKPNDNQQSVRHGSLDLEQALESLRLEREGLAAQVKQLRQCLDKLGLVSETAVVGQHKQQVGMQQSASGPGGAASLSAASKSSSGAGSGGSGSGGSGSLIGRPLVLSTNMQRMKRMDTLKRRKIKRDQQQQQLQQQQSMASSPRLVSPLSSSSSAIQENSASYRHTPAAPDEQLNMERPPMPPKPPPLTNPGLKQETTQTATGRQAQQSVLAYHQSPTENNNLARTHHSSSRVSCGGGAEEAILESADEADSTIDEEPSAVSAQTAAIYEGQQHQPSKRMIDKDDGGPTRQPIGSRPLDGRGSQGNNARPVVTPSVEKEPSLDDVGQARAAPGQRPKLKQQQSAAATTAYIYQSFRSSLTSLLNETVGQQRSTTTTTTNEQTLPRDKGQPEGRKRFSLNAFGMGLSAAIGSPFSSPTKNYSQGRKQPTGSVDQAQTKIISEQQQAIAMARRNTSGSQSGSSGGGSLGMSHQHQRPSSGRGSSGASTSAKRKSSSNSSSGGNNCSCLKSSSSNHSVESENQMIK